MTAATFDPTGYVEKRNTRGAVYHENGEGDIVAKRCTKCGEVKNLASYHKHTSGLAGVASRCRKCKNEKSLRWYAKNKKKQAGTGHRYYEKNKVDILERSRLNYENNRERKAGTSRQWREINKERQAHTNRRWRGNNKGKCVLYYQRYRARKLALPDSFTDDQQTDVLGYFGGCALTGFSVDVHLDHTIPVSIGHGGTIAGNMTGLSAELNKSKGERHLFEWFDANRDFYSLDADRFDRLIEYLAQQNAMTTAEYRAYVDWCHDNPADVHTDANGTKTLRFKRGPLKGLPSSHYVKYEKQTALAG